MNHIADPYIIKAIFLDSAILGSLGIRIAEAGAPKPLHSGIYLTSEKEAIPEIVPSFNTFGSSGYLPRFKVLPLGLGLTLFILVWVGFEAWARNLDIIHIEHMTIPGWFG